LKKFLVALAAACAIGGGTYALTASGASTPGSPIYGGGHFNVNLGGGFSLPRDFSLNVQGTPTAATGTVQAGLNQGGGLVLTIDVKCFNISSTPNASGGRTAVVGGFLTTGPHVGNQVVFFVQDNASPGGPANAIYDQASSFEFNNGGILTITPNGTTCPDANSTKIIGADVLYTDVPYGDVVVNG
jgi:hypothetical protein